MRIVFVFGWLVGCYFVVVAIVIGGGGGIVAIVSVDIFILDLFCYCTSPPFSGSHHPRVLTARPELCAARACVCVCGGAGRTPRGSARTRAEEAQSGRVDRDGNRRKGKAVEGVERGREERRLLFGWLVTLQQICYFIRFWSLSLSLCWSVYLSVYLCMYM